MRILVYPHELSLGGSQINAIDLASRMAELGHDVLVYGVPGDLTGYVREQGLRFVSANGSKYRPSPMRILEMLRLVQSECIDLIHCYEWPPCLDAYFGAGLFGRVPILCTVLSMSVMPQVPRSVPLIMGTRELSEAARQVQAGPVWTLEPPIDTQRDTPQFDGSTFRARFAKTDELLVVSVSRLAVDLKLDALVRAIDAADMLAARFPVKLVLVGDGPARPALAERARAVNSRHGRDVVVLAGKALDPREAYAAADVVVGMGSSAIRAMSMGRPVVVQGEAAFSEVFSPQTFEIFELQGFYGLADAEPGAQRLAAQLSDLLARPDERRRLGRYGREVAVERFSLERAAERQLDIYTRVVQLGAPGVRDAARSALSALGVEVENHDPRVKRARSRREASLLAAASAGVWPTEA